MSLLVVTGGTIFIIMYGDNISLDEVRTDNKYNLATIYGTHGEIEDDNTDIVNHIYDNNTCEYFEPEDVFKHINSPHDKLNKLPQSFFHLNCRGLSKNWERLHELICIS